MFMAVNIDLVSPDSQREISRLMTEYGIKKKQTNLFESFDFPVKKLGSLKRDLSQIVDMDDKLRLYQFPLEDTFKISYIEDGKWKRLSIK
jgi:hypothetical protein